MILTPKGLFPKETTLVDNQFGQGHSAGVIKRQAPSAWRRAPSLTLCFRSASGQSLMDRQYSSLSGGELFERITAEGYTMSEAEVRINLKALKKVDQPLGLWVQTS